MMKMKTFLGIVLAAFFIKCSADSVEQVSDFEPLTDVLTLEVSFGDKDVPDEYLLARPMAIAVNSGGDIYVADEDRLKVFDQNGNPKAIVGGQGEGPGEFRQLFEVAISPNGFITAGIGYAYNSYKSNHDFILKHSPFQSIVKDRLIRDFGYITGATSSMPYLVSKSEFVYRASGRKNAGDGSERSYVLLIQERYDEIAVLAEYQNVPRPVLGGRPRPIAYSGDFLWGMLPENRIVYTHTAYDKSRNQNDFRYILRTKSLDTGEEEVFSIPYERLEISESVIENTPFPGTVPEGTNLDEILKDKIRDLKYFPPVYGLLVDNEYVFLFVNSNDLEEKRQVHVINTNTGKQVSTVDFPYWLQPWTLVIKNGYVYRYTRGVDDFPVVEKYKIDPTVFGK